MQLEESMNCNFQNLKKKLDDIILSNAKGILTGWSHISVAYTIADKGMQGIKKAISTLFLTLDDRIEKTWKERNKKQTKSNRQRARASGIL